MKINKILLLLAFISIINLGWAQKKSYLKGNYKKENSGNIYTAQFQHKVDQIKDIADANAEIHNVILMIGDGMGVSQVFAAMSANNDELYIQYAKYIGFQKTKSVDKFTTDSAASGTALATGFKTTYKTIGLDEKGNKVKSILEIASKNDKATALVAVSKITHATPAAFIAHVPLRSQYEDIATFFVSDEIDVFIGGGLDNFIKREDSSNLIPQLEEKGFQVVTTPSALNEIQSGKIAALLAPGHFDKYPARGEFLVESTKKALEIVSQDKEGFFMMVEGSQIDWACHDNDVGYVIEEMLDFDRAVGEVLKFAERDGHTLVIITGDHETGGMSVHNVDLEKGEIEARFTTGGHSSVMIPVFAYGPGADLFLGVYENTAIFDKMMIAFGFEK